MITVWFFKSSISTEYSRSGFTRIFRFSSTQIYYAAIVYASLLKWNFTIGNIYRKIKKGPLEKGPVSVDTLSVWKISKGFNRSSESLISIRRSFFDEDCFHHFPRSLKFQEDGLYMNFQFDFLKEPKVCFGSFVIRLDRSTLRSDLLRNERVCWLCCFYCFTNFAVWRSEPFETSTTYIPAFKVEFNGRLSILLPSAMFTFWFIKVLLVIS